MGTVFSIDVRSPGCDRHVIEDVLRWLHWVDNTFSTYRPESHISRLSREELRIEDCPAEVGAILTRCQELETETAGYFSAYANGTLDPSGLVKGWAIQRASQMLAAAGSTSHCVNGGGDVHCAGRAHGGALWQVGVADPARPGTGGSPAVRSVSAPTGGLVAVVAGTDIAVATSGSAERGAHIVNPRTGRTPTALASVTLIGSDLGSTDAYATAAFAMGNDAPAWIDSLQDYRGLVIFADGRQWSSADFAAQP